MKIFRFELKKLLSSTILWGFLLICLLFNILLMVADGGRGGYANFVGASARDTGYVLGDSFNERLALLVPADDMEREYLLWLTQETADVRDVFEDYDTAAVGERYIQGIGIDGKLAESMRDKYQALQKRVDQIAERDEGLTLYFAGATYEYHRQLFGGVMQWLLTESVLLSSLIVLLALSNERTCRTEQMVYASRTGRKLVLHQLLAAICSGIGAYLLLALTTLAVYFSIHDYGGIRHSSVSSVFNYITDLTAGTRPFVTWYSFTVVSYLMATILISMVLLLCFMLMAFVIGLLVRNSYIGFALFILFNAASIQLCFTIPATSLLIYLFAQMPVLLWLQQAMWFTDGGANVLWPHYETWGAAVSLLLLGICCLLAENRFGKRDLL